MRRANASELLLSLDRDAPASIHRQLEEQLRASIRAGRLRPDTVLPSSRTLAAELGVGRNAVAEAYAQLQAEGYLSARGGSGTRVAAGAAPAPLEPETDAATAAIRFDFFPGVPDLTSFPRRAWARSARRSLACREHRRVRLRRPARRARAA